jgi:septum formation protein
VTAVKLLLASASPQRRTLLEGLGIPFTVEPPSLDESLCTETDPLTRAGALAKMKADDVAGRNPDSLVLGCDTLVVAADGTLLEKPSDAEDAARMLQLLSGRTCTVHSALCLIGSGGAMHEGVSSSKVTFKKLTSEDIAWWVSTGEWRDRSGSFQIDGKGQLLIKHLEGDWSGVVGLPVFLLGELLKKAHVPEELVGSSE